MPKVSGVLVLVGGEELKPGNEQQDRVLVEGARRGPAYVLPTAAARHGPEQAVANAIAWFGKLGLALEELRVLGPADAGSRELAEHARRGGFFYLVGGDPGLVARVLRDSRVWAAIVEAWLDGASLAGSSAGAMALCSHTLIRARWPNRFDRRPNEALGLVPDTAVLPHCDSFGHRWIESARRELPSVSLLGLDERTAAVWQDGRWRAMGPGLVTLIKGSEPMTFQSGSTITGLASPVRMLASR